MEKTFRKVIAKRARKDWRRNKHCWDFSNNAAFERTWYITLFSRKSVDYAEAAGLTAGQIEHKRRTMVADVPNLIRVVPGTHLFYNLTEFKKMKS